MSIKTYFPESDELKGSTFYRSSHVWSAQDMLTCSFSSVQHIFCDECIALWFNREKSCPLCRTVITEKVYKWRDGATSPHLQIY